MKKLLALTFLFLYPLFGTVVTIDEPQPLMAQEEVIQKLPTNYEAVFFKTFLMIAGGLALVFLLMIVFKRFAMIRYSNMNQNSYIKVIERRPISQKSTLYLVQIGDQKVMIAESQLEIKKITDLT
jgi:flagellar biogenesis protein FliO